MVVLRCLKLNRLTEVYENNAFVASYTYDVNGNRASMTYANSVKATYLYNAANLVTTIRHDSNWQGIFAIDTQTYTLDGNMATKIDYDDKETWYEYDGLGRLTKESEVVNNNIVRNYTYDTAGNRATMAVTDKNGVVSKTVTYTYDANNRLLKEVAVETKTPNVQKITDCSYDANGNMIGTIESTKQGNAQPQPVVGGHVVNMYDVFNRLILVRKGGVPTASYACCSGNPFNSQITRLSFQGSLGI